MKTSEENSLSGHVGQRNAILLGELREECENVLRLLTQLELPDIQTEPSEVLLGKLSAAILHLHAHTRGLDELVDREAR